MTSTIQIPLERVVNIHLYDDIIKIEVEGRVINYKEKTCKYCNKKFIPQSPNNQYCSEKCKKNARRETLVQATRKYRKLYKDVQTSSDLKNVGTSSLGPHRDDNFEEELRKIEKEMKRLKL